MLVVPVDFLKSFAKVVCPNIRVSFQLRSIIKPERLHWVYFVNEGLLPVEALVSDICLCGLGLLKQVLAGVEVLRVGLRVEDPLIQQETDVFQSCLLVHVAGKALPNLVSVVLPISITVHVLHARRNPSVVPLCLLLLVSQIRRGQLELGKLVVNIVIPLCFQV